MADKPASSKGPKQPASREDRLKQALKANLARRKAQARARSSDESGQTGKTKG